MSTSVKHENFINESMKGKSNTVLPGIGEVLSKRLIEEGYNETDTILAQYLLFKKHKDLFQEWMKVTRNANSKQSSDCFNAIESWVLINL